MQPIPFLPWTWRDPSWTGEPQLDDEALAQRPDTGLVGYHVEATDGGIGKVDEDDAEVPHDSLMVDTGPWIFGRKVVLPVGVVHRVDHHERKVFVDRTREQIKNAPEYSADEDYRDRTADYYTESYRLMPPML
ncbi:PRC-barrel domain containing protein [Lentzea sp. NPDC060358]|uniref:PRC-barrel domain containing protein n=1 Tax=Lentzea sp. NPDC060358 TaxID=3347103 RepID=UPI003665D776